MTKVDFGAKFDSCLRYAEGWIMMHHIGTCIMDFYWNHYLSEQCSTSSVWDYLVTFCICHYVVYLCMTMLSIFRCPYKLKEDRLGKISRLIEEVPKWVQYIGKDCLGFIETPNGRRSLPKPRSTTI
jgi:hypothetical protein